MNLRRILSTAATFGVAALAGACAQQVGDIDRTSDNALSKSMFEGEWYMVQTVVDTNATATYTFAGLQSGLERVEFEFDQNFLYARRTHENIQGLDTADTNLINDLEFSGSIVSAWPANHFDIQRSYNPATGEESNVIGENGSDRRWYEQDYARVNWNNNAVVTDGNSPFSGSIQSGSMIVLAPEESDATLFTDVNDEGDIYYFDYVTTYITETDWFSCIEQVGFPNWGMDCGTEEIVVRTSFLRVDDNTQDAHVPRRYDDWDMNLFGFFRTNRCFYDDRYGCTDFSRVQLANVHDIWRNERDENGAARPYYERDVDPISYYISYEYPIDLLDDTFEIADQFDWAFRRTVASAQGKSVDEIPRMFYMCLNPGSTDPTVPQEFLDVTRNPEDRELLARAFAASAEGYENGECERPGVVKNQGDIRYNFFNWRTDPSAPWYGYGPSAADPLSGEIIQGVANFNGGYLNRHAEQILNYVKIIGGDLTPEEYGYGVSIQDYFDRLADEANYDLYFGEERFPGAEDKDLDLEHLRSVNVAEMMEVQERNAANLELAYEILDRDHVQSVLARDPNEFRLRNGRQADPLASIVGTPIERTLMVPEFVEHMSLGNVDPSEDTEEEEWLNWISPVRFARHITANRSYERLRDQYMEQNVLLAPEFDYEIVGFANDMYRLRAELAGLYPDMTDEELDYELWLEIRGRIYTGVQSHEIGHTIGFRHNFAGTTDAMNYFPQYWALRQQTFDNDCDGDGVRSFDSIGYATGEVAPALCSGSESAEETAQRSVDILSNMRDGVLADGTRVGSISHYEYSTVMDYHGEFNGRQGGLGLYDYAAVAYGYGEMVERFVDAPHRISVESVWNNQTGSVESTTVTRHPSSRVSTMDDVEEWTRRVPGDIQADAADDDEFDFGWTFWHYSVLPYMFYDDAAGTPADPVANAYHPDHIDYTGLAGMSEMYNRSLVSASDCMGADCVACADNSECGDGQRCYRNPMNPRQANGTVDGFCVASRDAVGVDTLHEEDLRVPYRFCSDHRRGSSSWCNIFDSGADEYEMVRRAIADYENYYATTAFRRGRPGFGLWLGPYIDRLISRTFGPLINHYQFWLLNASGRGYEWYGFEGAGLHQTLAMQDALNMVADVLTTPTVGTYVPDDELGGRLVNVDEEMGFRFPSFNAAYGDVPESEYVDIGIADGARYGYSQFYRRREDDQAGFYFFLQYDVISHFFAKYAAMIALTDGSVDVIGADTSSDNTAFFIPPYLAFPDEVGNFMGGIIAEDWGNFGQCVTTVDGETSVDPIQMLRSSSYSCGGSVLNPYTEVYGNRDYNMKLYATLFSAAFFAQNLDYSWLDHSSVYLWGRGEQPEIVNDRDEDFEWITYTDDRGNTYGARYIAQVRNPDYDPTVPGSAEFLPVDPDDFNGDYGPNVGYRLVQRAIDLQLEMDTIAQLEEEAAANGDPFGLRPQRTAQDVYFEIQNHLEIVRFLIETNKVYQF